MRLSVEQAQNATTIAAVAERDGLADRAVTVALAAALQESKLRNVAYGDLDSLGLFQQRPSQGWGAPSQLLVPSYAAGAFYAALAKVPGWEALPIADAAQAVQHSAAGDAYAQWEHQAQVITDALSGVTPTAFSCRFVPAPSIAEAGGLAGAVNAELGPSALGSPLSEARGWTVASWLIAHGPAYDISSVTFMGQMWTAASGGWLPHLPALASVEVNGI